MANVKSRPNAHRSASMKSRISKVKEKLGRGKKSNLKEKVHELLVNDLDSVSRGPITNNKFKDVSKGNGEKSRHKHSRWSGAQTNESKVPTLSKEKNKNSSHDLNDPTNIKTPKSPNISKDTVVKGKSIKNTSTVQIEKNMPNLLPPNDLSKSKFINNTSKCNNNTSKETEILTGKSDVRKKYTKSSWIEENMEDLFSPNDLSKGKINNDATKNNKTITEIDIFSTTKSVVKKHRSSKSTRIEENIPNLLLSSDLNKNPFVGHSSNKEIKKLNKQKSCSNIINNSKCMITEESQRVSLPNMINNKKYGKNVLTLTKESLLLSKSGRIKKKSKDHLKILDNILKSELMIGEKKKQKHTQPRPTVQNNNDIEISNQNAPVSNVDLPNNTTIPENNTGNESAVQDERSNKKEKTNKSDKLNHKEVELINGRVLTLPVFQCNYCGKTFSNKKSICRHIYVHIDTKSYQCIHCERKFSHQANMQIHIRKFHTELPKKNSYMCQVCKKIFEFKQTLISHLELHIKNEKYNKCVFCNSKFPNSVQLVKHQLEHLETGEFVCSLCNMKFDSATNLAKHSKTHLRPRGYICQYCGKDYTEMSSMRRHLQVAHTGMRVVCPICNKKLKGHLSEHMRVHEQDRPHECDECGQRFTQSTQLNVHRRCHTGARPYPCRICKRCFTHSNALMLHIRRHTGEKPFPCAMCHLSFSQLPHMKAHMRNIHGKENAYKCQKCGQFFKLKVHLENHGKKCTVGDKEKTEPTREEKAASAQYDEIDSVMSISRMRFLLALLLTMIASQDKLKYLGFNKRLIDDILMESLEAMDQKPCKNKSLSPVRRLKTNIEILLQSTIPKGDMEKFRRENKSTEELLEILTDAKKNYVKKMEPTKLNRN